MKAFVNKLCRSNEEIPENDDFYAERKQLNSLNTYYFHSLLYLERLDRAVKDINIMICDLNTCLMSFFEGDVHVEIIKPVSYALNAFNSVRDKVCNQIIQSKHVVNSHLEKIKVVKNLCLKKKKLSESIDHYEKKIQKLQLALHPSQKHLDRILRNENKLNKVKEDYHTCYDNINKGINEVLDNRINKVLTDAKRDLELMLHYFSLMNNASLKLKELLKVFEAPVQKKKKDVCTLPIEGNFFLEQEDRMNYFYENPDATNPFTNNANDNTYTPIANSKQSSKTFNLKSFIKNNDKKSKMTNPIPLFPQ